MRTATLFSVVLLVAAFAGPAIAQDDGGMSMTPEQMAQMDAIMEKYVNPGPEHELLSPLAGTFDYTSRFWMAPGTDGIADAGTAEYTWMHGRRFLRQSASGTAMGLPFEGTGIMGFDRYRGEFFSIWFDNMTTSTIQTKGHADESGKVITFEGTVDNVWEDVRDQWTRTVITIESDDAHRLETFVEGPDGEPYRNFEIVYTRRDMAAK
jgi:hypothetical protein